MNLRVAASKSLASNPQPHPTGHDLVDYTLIPPRQPVDSFFHLVSPWSWTEVNVPPSPDDFRAEALEFDLVELPTYMWAAS